MSADWAKLEDSKRELRRKLAALPPAAKLDLMDELRDRLIALNKKIKTNSAPDRGSGGAGVLD